ITSQAQDYSTIFADYATGFCLICCNPCNNRLALIPEPVRGRLGWVAPGFHLALPVVLAWLRSSKNV
ncbi:hypothetical protein, partial [Achromobacter marplatensis]|uniref:hypothetical protein n=1 Tax=Achromobacter marplatensis TaxID=470868 RepID=UPI001C2E6C76